MIPPLRVGNRPRGETIAFHPMHGKGIESMPQDPIFSRFHLLLAGSALIARWWSP